MPRNLLKLFLAGRALPLQPVRESLWRSLGPPSFACPAGQQDLAFCRQVADELTCVFGGKHREAEQASGTYPVCVGGSPSVAC